MSAAGWSDYADDHDDLAQFVRKEDRGRSLTRNVMPGHDDDLEDKAARFARLAVEVDPGENVCAYMQRVIENHCDGSRDHMRDGHYAAICGSLAGHTGLAVALDALSSVREGRPGHARDVRRSIEGGYKRAMTRRGVVEPTCSCPGSFEVIKPKPKPDEDEQDDDPDETSDVDRYADLDMDLTAYLDGEVEPVPTDRGMARGDGLPLLYAGLTHMAVGETEAGKSWLALACAMAEMAAGRRVLYIHFEESDPRGTVLRLRQMGARREWFAAGLFRFAGIELPLAPDRIAPLVEHAPDLAVIDGVNAAMALHGMNPDKADEYGQWDQRLARPLAATGAAVLSLDHVVKNAEQAARGYAGGTVMKLNLISGASFLLENRDPLRPGAKGATSVYVAKDRPGALRAVGEVRSGRRALLGTFWVDSTSALTVTSWTAPAPEEVDVEDERPVNAAALKVLAAVVRMSEEKGREKPPSTTEVRRAKSGVGANLIAGHLDTLEAHGLLGREKGDGGTRWLVRQPAAEKALQPPGTTHPDDL